MTAMPLRNVAMALACALLLTAGATCDGKDSPRKVSNELVAALSELNDILDGVTDESSADAAVPKINAMSSKLQKLGERARGMKTTKAEDETLRKEFEPKLTKQQERMTANMRRIAANPAAALKLMQPMQNTMRAFSQAVKPTP